MPPKVTLEDDDSSDSGPDNNEPLNYEWKPRFPGAATPEANVDQILNISTGVHRGVLIMAKPLLKTGNLSMLISSAAGILRCTALGQN